MTVTKGNGVATRKSIGAPNPPLQDGVFKMARLDGKTVIITGGACGIGYEVARGLAEAGANIATWYNTSKQAASLAATIAKDLDVKTKTYQVAVEDYSAVEKAVTAVIEDFGRLDVMIANAGIPTKAGSLDDKSKIGIVCALWISMAHITVHELVDVCLDNKAVNGNCIFTASMSGHAANVPQKQACYNACKAGVIHLTKSLAVEWAKWGGRVNCVSPGYIDTAISGDCPFKMKEEWFSLTPMKRDADPKELKGAYLYLVSDVSTYTTGSDIVVDGGYTCR